MAGWLHRGDPRRWSRLVAEGVEEPAERDALLARGVRYGQGYLFGRPRAAGEVVAECRR